MTPLFAQYPAGSGAVAAGGKTNADPAVTDVVDIRSRMTGVFTAAASDTFSMRTLFQGAAPAGGSIAGFKVALRSDGSTGQLTLDGNDVTTKHSFTADEFARLQYVAGPAGSSEDLVVVAQTGQRQADGSVANEVDSPAVQITANVTGTRSLNAIAALNTPTTGSDAAFVSIARQASIFNGYGAARPGLSTVGNLTAAASDTFSVGKLFTATPVKGGSITGFKVALRSDGSSGQLTLDGNDVTTKRSFTADEFARLQYVAGPAGSSEDLVVVAQSGQRLPDGSIANEVDSPAVQITASATGTRSINAIAALNTPVTGSDAAFVDIAHRASVFNGYGAPRPNLNTVGNLTAASSDTFSMRTLFQGAAAKGGSIAAYKVALRSDGSAGQLTLDGNDVTTKHSFTADEFARLQYVAGPAGSSEDLVVIAQSGQRLPDGTLGNEVDSPAVQITAGVTGTRSINAIAALNTPTTGSDAAFVSIARQASIFNGYGAARPGLGTVGNMTASASDTFSMRTLFQGTAAKGSSIAGFKVALRSDGNSGQLTLDGNDVTTKRSFTADEFARLQYVAGPAGSSEDLVVVAQSGQRQADGSIANEVDSPAVQITASVTGTRSLNAIAALNTPATGNDAAFVSIARGASIFNGYGAARPSLGTVGNLTAAASDTFSVRTLFKATPATGGSIAGYKVALRSDGTLGQLTLDGNDVTTKHSFTADEFARLQYVAGPAGSSEDLVVVAQSGQRQADGSIANEVDSPAVQITASVTGTRSINAVAALNTPTTGSDAAFVSIARQASIFNGYGAARPSLTGVGGYVEAASTEALLDTLLDAFKSSETPASTAPNLETGFAGANGQSQSSANPAPNATMAALTWALAPIEIGGFQSAGNSVALQRIAAAAYQSTNLAV